jgi:hypothetical protein
MPHERNADLDGKLADLEQEIWLALKQGAFSDSAPFQWKAIVRDGDAIGVALLTIALMPPVADEAADEVIDASPAAARLTVETIAPLPPIRDHAGFSEPRCRNWLRMQGQSYPRSQCEICGSVVAPNWRCRYGIEG